MKTYTLAAYWFLRRVPLLLIAWYGLVVMIVSILKKAHCLTLELHCKYIWTWHCKWSYSLGLMKYDLVVAVGTCFSAFLVPHLFRSSFFSTKTHLFLVAVGMCLILLYLILICNVIGMLWSHITHTDFVMLCLVVLA